MEADQEILNLKPITAEMNILSRSDGSVIITQGKLLSIPALLKLFYDNFQF
jgi:ribonuclease PH